MSIRGFIATLALMVVLATPTPASTSIPFKILSSTKNAIVWQRIGNWLMMTEDLTNGRVCYFYDRAHSTKLNLKTAQVGNWMPLGSAIKWLMFVDDNKLMAHDVDWHFDHIARSSIYSQVGVGMTGVVCAYGQNRASAVNGIVPVDIYAFNIENYDCPQITSSASEKNQFAHDGTNIVYRARYSASDVRICGVTFAGNEFEVAARDGIEPSICGNLVAWGEASGAGYNIMAKNIATGELRTIAYTTANPPCPEVGNGAIFWEDARTSSTTGLDIYGYDWETKTEFIVINTIGDQYNLRVCNDIVTYATGATNYRNIWGATIIQPVRISDLRPTAITANSVNLSWTNPGASSNSAISYDLRMRTDAPIDDSNWSSSIVVSGLPTPSSAGSSESFSVLNLTPGTVYFAIKATMQNGDVSLISNCVCAFVSDAQSVLQAPIGAYVSFPGQVTGVRADGEFYCRAAEGIRSVKVIAASGQATPGVGQGVVTTGIMQEDSEFVGLVISNATVDIMGIASGIRGMGMRCDAVGPLNVWMRVRTWGKVSYLTVSNGFSMNISDGSSPLAAIGSVTPPMGLVNGSFVCVEGIARFTRASQRQVEILDADDISIISP